MYQCLRNKHTWHNISYATIFVLILNDPVMECMYNYHVLHKILNILRNSPVTVGLTENIVFNNPEMERMLNYRILE